VTAYTPSSKLARLAAAIALVATLAPWPLRAAEIEIVPVTSEGGITAWLYEDHTIPIVTLEAAFLGGASLEPSDEAGVTALMAALLSEGAGAFDATGFAEATQSLAASFDFSASADVVSVSATTLKETLEPAFDLLASALAEPRFDERSLERVRAEQLASLRADATDPNRLASRRFWADAFPGHPYATPADGLPETVAALDRDAVAAAHRRGLARDRLMVAVVGAISADELGPLLDRVFGALPAEGPPLPEPAEPSLAGTVTVIDLPIPQSVVTFGHAGIPRDDPDFIPAFVMDHILGGGGFGSRLTGELREKRGLTYGIYTYLAPNDYGWLYLGSFSASNARVAEAIELVRAEWARMAEEGVTEAELDEAKRYLTGAYPLRFDGNSRIASQLLGLQTAGLGIDYVNERNALVEAVTLADIERVARRIIDPDALSFVVVGQPEGVAPTE
jgi:zinc protease